MMILQPPQAAAWQPGAADVHVWRATLACPPDHLEARAMRSSELRRAILATYMGCAPAELRFQPGAHGKPALIGAEAALRFNVSHAGDDWLIAVSRTCEVGIDVEHIRPLPQLEALAARTLSPDERQRWQALGTAEATRALLLNWTRKEALLKAWGVGLALPMDALSVGWAGTGAVASDADGLRWEIRDLPLGEGRLAAVARPGSGWRLASATWPEEPPGCNARDFML